MLESPNSVLKIPVSGGSIPRLRYRSGQFVQEDTGAEQARYIRGIKNVSVQLHTREGDAFSF